MENIEVRKFDAEIGKVLNLMINSLYTNKDIFLRELISNASDACDKLKYESLKTQDLTNESDMKITIETSEEAKELIISDNGIGMNKEELIENLGTIARSGTQKFLEQIQDKKSGNINLIGQFGVGFYSAFMVAQEVTVMSKKVDQKETWLWNSNGEGEFTIQKSDHDLPVHGTKIVLKLKEGEEAYTDKFKIQHIISTYSDHISTPIQILDKEGKADVINSSSAIWMRSKSQLTDEEYKEFYKKISYSGDEPWMIFHNKNEGTIEYTNLLFIPTNKTFDLFHPDRKTRVKLYINRVFINDEGIEIIPKYLRFLRGVVDSSDLPLNISRETLQHNLILEKISKSIIKRVLGELYKKLKEDKNSYINFWKNFGAAIKEGLCEHSLNHEDLLQISLFKNLNSEDYISLDEYIANMKEGQEEIYYISGDDESKNKNHPRIEGFKAKGVDVLLFTDTVDDFWVNVINSYKDKKLVSVTRSSIDLSKIGDTTDEIKDNSKTTDLVEHFKKVLGNSVKDVKISNRLTSSPVCIAVDEGSMDIRMEKFLKEQNQIASTSSKILEINPSHQIIVYLNVLFKDSKDDKQVELLIRLLFDQACILDGINLESSSEFAKRLNALILEKIDA